MNATLKRRLVLGALLLVAYAVVHWAFARQSEGLFTPETSVNVSVMTLGLTTIVLRLVGLFVVVPLGVYRAMVALLGGFAKVRSK